MARKKGTKVAGSQGRRAVIWALAVVAVLAAAAWGAMSLRQPAGSAAALPNATAEPTREAVATEAPSPTPSRMPPTGEPARSPEPTATATLYIISAVQIAPRQPTPTAQTTDAAPGDALAGATGRIEIPALGIDQPIVPVSWRMRVIDGQPVAMWDTVKGAVGHHRGSAGLGEPGNTVLTGHTRGDGLGEFQNLWDLQEGQEVRLYDAQGLEHIYLVESVMILQEIGLTVEQRQENARYLQPTDDTRLTLVTCWPEWVYTHRVIVIAKPR